MIVNLAHILVFSALFSMLGCFILSKKTETAVSEVGAGPTVRSLAEAASRDGYDVQKIHLSFRPGNSPGVLANVSIKGKAYQFLIDTGASGHFVHEELVRELQIKQIGVSQGSTPYGDIQTILLEPQETVIDQIPILLTDSITVFNEPSNGLKEAGIYGLLSPPKLAIDALVVLDHSEPALYIVKPVPMEPTKWLEQYYRDFTFEEVPRVNDPNPYRELLAATSDIFGDLTMTLDSGATTTIIYSDKVVNPRQNLSIKVKNFRCNTNRAIVRPTGSPGHGNHLLGMDCLIGKILAFAPMDSQYVWIGWR